MADALIGLGIAKGSEAFGQWLEEKPVRDMRLQEARARQDKANMELEEYKANAPIRKTMAEAQLQQTQAQLQQIQGTLAKQQAFDAFRMYQADGDTKHLNGLLQNWRNNPVAKNLIADYARIDKISEQDAALLQSMGISDVKGFLADPEARSNLVRATLQDGTVQLLDMNGLYAGTGYAQAMADAELERQQKRALINSRMRQGSTRERLSKEERIAQQLMQENPDLTFPQAYRQVVEMGKNPNTGSTELERTAKRLLDEGKAVDWVDAMDMAMKLTKPTSTQKELANTDELKDEIDSLVGGSFFDIDPSALTPQQNRQIDRAITKIEKLSGTEMTADQKKRAGQIKQMISLGGTAGSKLTNAETGVLDSMLRDIKKYAVNEVGGTEGTAAYETARNIVRNALFGASLTTGESEAFDKSFGTLREQTAPVLAKLRTQMTLLRDELDGLMATGDEYVMKHRIGADMNRVADVIDAIDTRLEMFDNAAPEGTDVIVPTNDKRPGAKDIPVQEMTPEQRKAALRARFQ